MAFERMFESLNATKIMNFIIRASLRLHVAHLSSSCPGLKQNLIEIGPLPFDAKLNKLSRKIGLLENEFGDLEIYSKNHLPCYKNLIYLEHVN